MNYKLKNVLLASIGAASLATPYAVYATNGYFSHGYGIKSKGIAGAGVAYSQDALAPATNPAGIAHVGNRYDFGLEVFSPDRSAKLDGTGSGQFPNTTFDANETDIFYIPEFGYSRNLNDKMTVGVAVFGNGGLNTDYADPIYSRSNDPNAPNDLKPTGVDLSQLFITPTFAMKLNEQHTVGVALNIAYQRFEAKGLSNFIGFKENPSTGTDGLTDQGYDDSLGFGLRLGWEGAVHDRVTLGASYQTKTSMEEFDKYDNLFAEKGAFDIPASFTIGAAFEATPTLTAVLDIQRIMYSDIPSIANDNCGFVNPHPGNCDLGDSNGPGFGWDDMTIFKLGLVFTPTDKLTLRAGYSHGDQPIDSSQTAFNVIAPAVIEDHLTFGATWELNNGAELSAYYMHAFENTVEGTDPSPAAQGAQAAGHGDLTMNQNAIGIAYGWEF